MLLQNIDHYEYLPFAIAVLPRTLESSSGALCEPQTSENTRYFKSHRVKELKFTLELAVMAHRGSRGIGQCHAPATLSPAERSGTQRTGGWLGPESDLARTGMRYPDRPVRSKSSVTGFSDETHFHFDANINKYSDRMWPAQNPRLTVTNPLHPHKVTVWRASPSVGIFIPVFSEGLVSSNFNFSLVRDELFPFLIGSDISLNTGRFQQGSNRRHTITVVLDLFIMLRGVRNLLNLYLTRIEHCECYLLCYVEDEVYVKHGTCNVGSEICHSVGN